MGLFDTKTESRGYAQPWGIAAPHLGYATGLIGEALQTPLEYFPDQTYAAQTEAERQALEQLQAGAGAYGDILGGYLEPATDAYRSALMAPETVMGMGLQDVASNPYLAGAAEAIQARVNRNLQENIMPGLTRAGVAGGGLGGTAQGVAEGIAARGTSDVLAEQLAGLYGGAWEAGLGAETSRLAQALSAQQGAMGMAPGMAQAALTGYTQPAAMLGQIGRIERGEEQRAIDEAMARHEFEQMEPWQRAGMGYDMLMPAATAFGSRFSESQVHPSTLSNIGQMVSLAGTIMGQARKLFTGGGLSAAGAGAGAGAGASQWAGGMSDPWQSGGMAINPYQLTSMMPANIGGYGSQPSPWMWGR